MLHEIAEVLYFFVPAYVANMSPVLVRGRFERLAKPIDGGCMFRGKRILGDHKTWRGLIAAVFAGVLAFELQRLVHRTGLVRGLAVIDYADVGLSAGFLMGLGTGVGDAVKSFFKRRIGIAPGSTWLGFDQLDFFAGACLFTSPLFVPPLVPTLLSLPIVFAGSVTTTAIGYWLGMKESWL